MGESSYSLVQTDFSEIPESFLTAMLVERGGMLKFDARQIAKRNRGILCELPQDKAESVAAALCQAKLPAVALDSNQIPELPRPHVVPWVQTAKEAIEFPFGIHQDLQTIPWSSIFVINSTTLHIRGRSAQIDSDESLLEGMESYREEVVARPTPVTDVVAITSDGAYRLVRIVFGHTANRTLRLAATEDDILPKSREYQCIVEELTDQAEFAIISEETRDMLATRVQRPRTPKNANWLNLGEVEFQKMSQWLLLMAVLKEHSSNAE